MHSLALLAVKCIHERDVKLQLRQHLQGTARVCVDHAHCRLSVLVSTAPLLAGSGSTFDAVTHLGAQGELRFRDSAHVVTS